MSLRNLKNRYRGKTMWDLHYSESGIIELNFSEIKQLWILARFYCGHMSE